MSLSASLSFLPLMSDEGEYPQLGSLFVDPRLLELSTKHFARYLLNLPMPRESLLLNAAVAPHHIPPPVYEEEGVDVLALDENARLALNALHSFRADLVAWHAEMTNTREHLNRYQFAIQLWASALVIREDLLERYSDKVPSMDVVEEMVDYFIGERVKDLTEHDLYPFTVTLKPGTRTRILDQMKHELNARLAGMSRRESDLRQRMLLSDQLKFEMGEDAARMVIQELKIKFKEQSLQQQQNDLTLCKQELEDRYRARHKQLELEMAARQSRLEEEYAVQRRSVELTRARLLSGSI
jgi:hypothetical protein